MTKRTGAVVVPSVDRRHAQSFDRSDDRSRSPLSVVACRRPDLERYREGPESALSDDESNAPDAVAAPRGCSSKLQSRASHPHSPARSIPTTRSAPAIADQGGKVHTVPEAITTATFKQYRYSPAVTEIMELPTAGLLERRRPWRDWPTRPPQDQEARALALARMFPFWTPRHRKEARPWPYQTSWAGSPLEPRKWRIVRRLQEERQRPTSSKNSMQLAKLRKCKPTACAKARRPARDRFRRGGTACNVRGTSISPPFART